MNRTDTPDRPSLGRGIIVAAVLAVAGAALFAALTLWFTPHVALRWITTLLAGSLRVGSPQAGTGETFTVSNLQPGTTYYWRVVAKNSAGSTSSATWKFATR